MLCEFPNKPIPQWNRSRNYNAYNISNRGCFTSNSSKKLPPIMSSLSYTLCASVRYPHASKFWERQGCNMNEKKDPGTVDCDSPHSFQCKWVCSLLPIECYFNKKNVQKYQNLKSLLKKMENVFCFRSSSFPKKF